MEAPYILEINTWFSEIRTLTKKKFSESAAMYPQLHVWNCDMQFVFKSNKPPPLLHDSVAIQAAPGKNAVKCFIQKVKSVHDGLLVS